MPLRVKFFSLNGIALGQFKQKKSFVQRQAQHTITAKIIIIAEFLKQNRPLYRLRISSYLLKMLQRDLYLSLLVFIVTTVIDMYNQELVALHACGKWVPAACLQLICIIIIVVFV